MRVNLLQDSYGIDIFHKTVGFFVVSEFGLILGSLLYSETWTPVGIQLVVDRKTGSKVIFPDVVGFSSVSTLTVPHYESCSKFLPPPSRKCPTSPSWSMLAVSLSEAWPTLHHQLGHGWLCLEAKGDNKLESKLEGLVILSVFVVAILSLLHVLGFSNDLVTPSLCDLLNLRNYASFTYPDLTSSLRHIIKTSVNISPPEEAWQFFVVWLGPLFNSCLNFEIGLPFPHRLSGDFEYPWGWIVFHLLSWRISSSKVYHSNGFMFI